ncbi:MAG: tetratricopeptide repeat protein, partial [Chromatiaceae bacterium]|nr:tetratricopeptide repeat protein [Chromatiaceae bacterium]
MRQILPATVAALTLVLVSGARADLFLNQEQEAYEHFQTGDYGQAAEGFGDDYRRGVALYKSGRYQEAADAFSRVERPAVKEDAGYNLGNARFQLGDFTGAAKAYEAVLSANPNHEDANYNLSLARAMLARMEQEMYEKQKEEQRRKKEEQERKEKERQEQQEKKQQQEHQEQEQKEQQQQEQKEQQQQEQKEQQQQEQKDQQQQEQK